MRNLQQHKSFFIWTGHFLKSDTDSGKTQTLPYYGVCEIMDPSLGRPKSLEIKKWRYTMSVMHY